MNSRLFITLMLIVFWTLVCLWFLAAGGLIR